MGAAPCFGSFHASFLTPARRAIYAAGSSFGSNRNTKAVRSAGPNDDFIGITNLQAAINHPHSRTPNHPEQDNHLTPPAVFTCF